MLIMAAKAGLFLTDLGQSRFALCTTLITTAKYVIHPIDASPPRSQNIRGCGLEREKGVKMQSTASLFLKKGGNRNGKLFRDEEG
jgi:hypothetical protein